MMFKSSRMKLADIYLKHIMDRRLYSYCYSEIVEKFPTFENYKLSGHAMMNINSPDEAVGYYEKALIEKEIQDVQGQINNYEIQNKQLQDLITYLQSDQSLEAQARLNLNMKKPGEGVIVVENKKTNAVQVELDSDNKLDSNLIKWWRYFFN